jgi:hypothetical protein
MALTDGISTSRLRAIEALAQRMYEAAHPGELPWSRRGWVIRKTWLTRAQQRLERAEPLLGGFNPRLLWQQIKSLFR